MNDLVFAQLMAMAPSGKDLPQSFEIFRASFLSKHPRPVQLAKTPETTRKRAEGWLFTNHPSGSNREIIINMVGTMYWDDADVSQADIQKWPDCYRIASDCNKAMGDQDAKTNLRSAQCDHAIDVAWRTAYANEAMAQMTANKYRTVNSLVFSAQALRQHVEKVKWDAGMVSSESDEIMGKVLASMIDSGWVIHHPES